MSTPAASTKSINSTNPDARDATNSPLQQNGTNGSAENEQNGSAAEPEGGYPEQRHAGAVGLGPEYGQQNRATAGDKIQGLKEQVAGKLTRNPEKAEHGKEMRTGELKRKQKEQDDGNSPFQNVDEDEKKVNGTGSGDAQQGNTTNDGDDQAAGNAAPTSVTGKRGPGTHPTEAGAQEQAATTAPEGTAKAERQAQGQNADYEKQIDEA